MAANEEGTQQFVNGIISEDPLYGWENYGADTDDIADENMRDLAEKAADLAARFGAAHEKFIDAAESAGYSTEY